MELKAKRPMKAGLPLAETQKKSAEIDLQVAWLLKGRLITYINESALTCSALNIVAYSPPLSAVY